MKHSKERTRLQALVGLPFFLGAGYVFFFRPEYVVALPGLLLLGGLWALWFFWPERRRYIEATSADPEALARRRRNRRFGYVGAGLIVSGFVLLSLLFLPFVRAQELLFTLFSVGGLFAVIVGSGLRIYRSISWWRDYLNYMLRR